MLHAKREDGSTHHREVDLQESIRELEKMYACARARECVGVCMCDMQLLTDLGLPCKESEAEYDDDRHANGYEDRVRVIPSEHGPTVP